MDRVEPSPAGSRFKQNLDLCRQHLCHCLESTTVEDGCRYRLLAFGTLKGETGPTRGEGGEVGGVFELCLSRIQTHKCWCCCLCFCFLFGKMTWKQSQPAGYSWLLGNVGSIKQPCF